MNGRGDKLGDLSFFELNLMLEASRVRSLRGLARKLGKKPAHLSKSIKRLETKLKIELFKRSASGMQITPEGVRLLPLVEEICSLGSKLTPNPSSKAQSKVLGISGVHFLQVHAAIPGLKILQKDFPSLRIRFVELLPDEFLQHAVAGTFDCAVHMAQLEWPRNWETRALGSVRFGLFARTDHPIEATASESDVLKYDFVIPTYWSEGKFVPGADSCPVPLSQRQWGHETASAVTAVEVLLHTDALSFVPVMVAAPLVERGKVREIVVPEWPSVTRTLFLTVHTERITKPVFKKLQSALAI